MPENLKQPNLFTINRISGTKYFPDQAFEAVQKKEKTAPEALKWLVERNCGFRELQEFCERCAAKASHVMPDLIKLWEHKGEPTWRGLVCALVNLKPVMLTCARVEPKHLPVMIKYVTPKYPLGMGDELGLLLAENKPDHAIELLEDGNLKLATVCKLAYIVCEEMPTYAWRAYQLISSRIDLMCGDHIALRLLAISAAERKEKRPVIISFLCNSIDSVELHEKFFAFWLKHKSEDKELVEQTKQDLKEALKK